MGGVERLVWLDKCVTGLAHGKQAPTFTPTSCRAMTTRRTCSSAAPTLASAKPITTTNPFQAKFAWSRSEVVEYKTDKGLRAAGGTLLPGRLRAG